MNFEEMYNAAHAAGVAAAEAANVELIGIAGRPEYPAFPICGFAWITLRPANSSFARWVAKNRGAHKAHGGGRSFAIQAEYRPDTDLGRWTSRRPPAPN